jgi:hypothetical protein
MAQPEGGPSVFSRDDGARTTEPAERGSSSQSRLTREQVLGRIIEINPTATRQFLDQFGKEALGRYLNHLEVASEPRSRRVAWDRPGDAPAIMCRESEA